MGLCLFNFLYKINQLFNNITGILCMYRYPFLYKFNRTLFQFSSCFSTLKIRKIQIIKIQNFRIFLFQNSRQNSKNCVRICFNIISLVKFLSKGKWVHEQFVSCLKGSLVKLQHGPATVNAEISF